MRCRVLMYATDSAPIVCLVIINTLLLSIPETLSPVVYGIIVSALSASEETIDTIICGPVWLQ